MPLCWSPAWNIHARSTHECAKHERFDCTFFEHEEGVLVGIGIVVEEVRILVGVGFKVEVQQSFSMEMPMLLEPSSWMMDCA